MTKKRQVLVLVISKHYFWYGWVYGSPCMKYNHNKTFYAQNCKLGTSKDDNSIGCRITSQDDIKKII